MMGARLTALLLEARWSLAAAPATSLCLAVVLFAAVQRRAFADILRLAQSGQPGPEAWLLPAALISTSLVLLAPGVFISIMLSLLGRRRASRAAFVTASSLVMLLALLDIDLLRTIGRHTRDIAAIALQPQGHVAGGSLWGWVVMVLEWAALAVLGTVVLTLACQRLTALITDALSPLLRWAFGGAAAVLLLMTILAPVLLLRGWSSHPVVERLYASALIDVRPEQDLVDDSTNLDPRLNDLYTRLRASYRASYPIITAGRPGDTRSVAPLPARPPNVILIVTESFRQDAFVPELMPRLTRWAERGVIADHHDAGTIYSQTGAFALLYGRSPAAYNQTLDAGVPPQFCASLRQSGYECAYFTGHPKEWVRREEFLNERTMDHFVHDDRGDWPDWDRRALDGMVQLANHNDKPVFAIVLLMSSHFEYRYPPKYEIDKPVSNTAWLVTLPETLGPEAEIPHRNRYRNCMRFVDDVVADAVDRLDPAKNLVIFTGDHAESINDDGHYTHGYSFSEVVTRTPFAMVGPGVAPARLDYTTLHADVLPSVLHVLTGRHQDIEHIHGIDWFAGERHASVLASHSPISKHTVQTQLRAAGRHLRLDLDLTRPNVTLLGFEDALARLQPTPDLTPAEVDALAGAFEDQLTVLRR